MDSSAVVLAVWIFAFLHDKTAENEDFSKALMGYFQSKDNFSVSPVHAMVGSNSDSCTYG